MSVGLLTGIVSASKHRKCMLVSNQKCMTQPTLINVHLNDTVKNFTTTHLRLNQIDVFEVVILLMTYLIKYVFEIKQDLNVSQFNMNTGKIEPQI